MILFLLGEQEGQKDISLTAEFFTVGTGKGVIEGVRVLSGRWRENRDRVNWVRGAMGKGSESGGREQPVL